jgi:Zn-dependent membrane protease YugP
MNPVLLLIPAIALVVGPRIWVKRVLNRYDRTQEHLPCTGGELARQLLDQNHLQTVKVEITDLGDHYDPEAKAVRLARSRFERKSLTALTTAAHEVGHALQHASGYRPFVWRSRLASMSRVTGEVGSVLLLAVPVAALASRRPIPPIVIGATALSILGVSAAAQLTAVPTEIDASFDRALPMLRNGYIGSEQLAGAREILTACSLTYVASSLLGVLNVWPWLPRPVYRANGKLGAFSTAWPSVTKTTHQCSNVAGSADDHNVGGSKYRTGEALIKRIATSLLRSWLGCGRQLQGIRQDQQDQPKLLATAGLARSGQTGS